MEKVDVEAVRQMSMSDLFDRLEASNTAKERLFKAVFINAEVEHRMNEMDDVALAEHIKSEILTKIPFVDIMYVTFDNIVDRLLRAAGPAMNQSIQDDGK